MKTITRVNFKNPDTGNYQNGFGFENDGTWLIRTYHDQVLELNEVNATFETHQRSSKFINSFFKFN